ncbi:hypothetical protein [Priestia taiwanensis]|uniref:Lipoprotein n=1 Tax=Priestia taiwanensis TaxID=1347902 RepID=A0A917EM65_9BACI|nr:hypothetical protein [Priestia taiwanensis]MBM7361567.1 hypothetical protein [Priestia taiwanensis]GGE55224.1 hypothetical protein GCM10007140_01920 [Priestia taiwanensis]
MRKLRPLFSLIFLCLLLSACTQKSEPLTKVTIQLTEATGKYGAEKVVSDDSTLSKIEHALHNVKWEKGVQPSMARKEDVFMKVTYEKREAAYMIWFNPNGSATLLGDTNDESYGTLEDAVSFKEIILLN